MEQAAVLDTLDVDGVATSGAARHLGCAENTVRALAARGVLPCVRVAGRRIFRVSDLERVRVARTRQNRAKL